MFSQSNADATVPALADIVGRYVSDLTLAGGQLLPVWLPTLPPPPAGWVIGQLEASQAPTRIALHPSVSGTAWDGCGVLNLFAFTGSVPRDVIEANTACTLRAVSADNLHSQPLLVPSRPGFDVAATSASGEFLMSGQRLRAQYTAYLLQAEEGSAAGDSKRNRRGGLVEHNAFITAEADPGTHRELTQMGDAVYEALKLALTQVKPT